MQMMDTEENDPDTLQILDETEKEWVSQWQSIVKRKKQSDNALTFILNSPDEVVVTEREQSHQ